MPAQKQLVQPKTRRGRRLLEARAPKLIEDPKKALVLYGTRTSPTIKELLSDVNKLKFGDSVRLTRNNDAHPMESGGETFLEAHARRVDAALFAFGSHTKKRPDNLVLGRFFDGSLLDCVEFGVHGYRGIKDFAEGAASSAAGNKPAVIFAGDGFSTDPELARAKSLLLDFFRGVEASSLNLAGLDRVIFAVADAGDVASTSGAGSAPRDPTVAPHASTSGSSGSGPRSIHLRSYAIKLKKSGTSTPRAALVPSGPACRLALRRVRLPPIDLEREAMKQPKLTRKKDKNERTDSLDGRVASLYVPRQRVDEVSLMKMKGLKRERREVAKEREETVKKGKAATV